jgi:chromosomal replication initiator protein
MQPIGLAMVSPNSVDAGSLDGVVAHFVGAPQFENWFRGRTQVFFDEGTLVIRAESPFLVKWLQKQFRAEATRAAQHLLGPGALVRFDAGPVANGASPAPEIPAAGLGPVVESQALIRTPTATPVVAREVVPAPEGTIRSGGRKFADLADFVAGPGTDMALTAVRQVCNRPDGQAGPLVLYGPVGMGKSHLLEGIYRRVRRGHPGLQVVLLGSEQFTNYFTSAYREHSLPAFRQRFRTVDVLLVDDIDFLDGKRAVQEEFLHTIKQLEGCGKLVVVTADRHPRLLSKISDELRTRLLSGMVCRIEPCDLETRERIAALKARDLAAEISPEALRYVAQRFPGSIRELCGALNCLQVYYSLTQKKIGVTAARQVLSDLERDCLRTVRLVDIERVVCELFGIENDALRSAQRTRLVTEPRMLAMYLARRHTRSAYSEIGRHFGGRNHTTVIAAERKVVEWLRAGQDVKVASRTWRLADIVETLEQQLMAG